MRWLTARRLVEAQFVEEALLINALDQAGSLEAMDLDGGADDRVAPIYLLCGTMDARMDFTEANEGNEGRTKAVILSIEPVGPVNLQMLFVDTSLRSLLCIVYRLSPLPTPSSRGEGEDTR